MYCTGCLAWEAGWKEGRGRARTRMTFLVEVTGLTGIIPDTMSSAVQPPTRISVVTTVSFYACACQALCASSSSSCCFCWWESQHNNTQLSYFCLCLGIAGMTGIWITKEDFNTARVKKKQGLSAARLILCRALMPIINKYAVCWKLTFSLLGCFILQKYVEQQAVLTLRVRSAVTSAQSWDGLLNKRIAVSLLFFSTLFLWIIIYASGMICIRPHNKPSQWYKAISFTHQA